MQLRSDFDAIANWVETNSSLLDLGCGDGSFLEFIRAKRKAITYGVEITDTAVLACVEKGLNVIQQDLEGGLALFKDQSFDTVVLSQTLQTIHQTERILREVVRVGKQCVVSFPNFGHWSHRYAVALGRMPVSKSLPYEWFNTPNVRVLTIADFEALAHKLGIEILGRVVLHHGKTVHLLPNLFGSLAIYRVCGAK
ncbi:methionine biosynthesis protein MetW [Polynucleobacter sp. MWH-UH24A]|jgi:methionine biosynthesis protein MetW|uniref:methionine biosynthesis protein MetW n=1 Tax=Polynucleobacter sp. MWH-UH24A TaxID=2689110 RepID=UPI001BFD3620|nr:methionine biosynthesis protein MetW [Polynucleobacter sp. MWH-UH24A]QWD76076.1 methionine biosynthesis protein MetW [Polynucleobacter sp. MWH-UH24A]